MPETVSYISNQQISDEQKKVILLCPITELFTILNAAKSVHATLIFNISSYSPLSSHLYQSLHTVTFFTRLPSKVTGILLVFEL